MTALLGKALGRWFATTQQANVALRGTIDTLLSFSNNAEVSL